MFTKRKQLMHELSLKYFWLHMLQSNLNKERAWYLQRQWGVCEYVRSLLNYINNKVNDGDVEHDSRLHSFGSKVIGVN